MELSTGQFKTLMDHLQEGVYFVDRDRIILYWNCGAEKITGFSAPEVEGSCCADDILQHVDANGAAICTGPCPLLAAIHDGQPRCTEAYLHHKEGHRLPVVILTSPIRDERGEIIGAVESFTDNSARMAALERIADLERAALICPLTGVGNRRYAEQFLQEKFDEWKRYAWPFGVIFIDVDRFKSVNDRFGHQVGDIVLKMVAQTLRNDLRSFDFLARWGGEEFIAVLPKMDLDALYQTANRLRLLVQNTARGISGNRIEVTVSLGATLAKPEDTLETLVKRADAYMYRSKAEGRNRVTADY